MPSSADKPIFRPTLARLAMAAICLSAAGGAKARATTYCWKGSASSSYVDAANWRIGSTSGQVATSAPANNLTNSVIQFGSGQPKTSTIVIPYKTSVYQFTLMAYQSNPYWRFEGEELHARRFSATLSAGCSLEFASPVRVYPSSFSVSGMSTNTFSGGIHAEGLKFTAAGSAPIQTAFIDGSPELVVSIPANKFLRITGKSPGASGSTNGVCGASRIAHVDLASTSSIFQFRGTAEDARSRFGRTDPGSDGICHPLDPFFYELSATDLSGDLEGYVEIRIVPTTLDFRLATPMSSTADGGYPVFSCDIYDVNAETEVTLHIGQWDEELHEVARWSVASNQTLSATLTNGFIYGESYSYCFRGVSVNGLHLSSSTNSVRIPGDFIWTAAATGEGDASRDWNDASNWNLDTRPGPWAECHFISDARLDTVSTGVAGTVWINSCELGFVGGSYDFNYGIWLAGADDHGGASVLVGNGAYVKSHELQPALEGGIVDVDGGCLESGIMDTCSCYNPGNHVGSTLLVRNGGVLKASHVKAYGHNLKRVDVASGGIVDAERVEFGKSDDCSLVVRDGGRILADEFLFGERVSYMAAGTMEVLSPGSVAAGRMQIMDQAKMLFTIPPTGYESTPITITGKLEIVRNARLEIDATARKHGTHTLIRAKSISGTFLPENIVVTGPRNYEVRQTADSISLVTGEMFIVIR